MIEQLLWVFWNSIGLACIYFLFLMIWSEVFKHLEGLRDAELIAKKNLLEWESNFAPYSLAEARQQVAALKEQMKKRRKTDNLTYYGLMGIGSALSYWIVSSVRWYP